MACWPQGVVSNCVCIAGERLDRINVLKGSVFQDNTFIDVSQLKRSRKKINK